MRELRDMWQDTRMVVFTAIFLVLGLRAFDKRAMS